MHYTLSHMKQENSGCATRTTRSETGGSPKSQLSCLSKYPASDSATLLKPKLRRKEVWKGWQNCRHRHDFEQLKRHVETKIARQEFPIMCPECVRWPKSKNPSYITLAHLNTLAIWHTEELAFKLAMQRTCQKIPCSKCKQIDLCTSCRPSGLLRQGILLPGNGNTMGQFPSPSEEAYCPGCTQQVRRKYDYPHIIPCHTRDCLSLICSECMDYANDENAIIHHILNDHSNVVADKMRPMPVKTKPPSRWWQRAG
ncbi:hypothetical protein BDN72DRAFT_147827 [Pluteus cervinus]|uniref:Uncharacterized protein n=1 Tax=Pluteus cervinus TaxID=181527 RepID=A0ACD3AM36_9AGAR|nr:hypothetical protein BDN72DRAFT_147827 [Pluteus cervinus]